MKETLREALTWEIKRLDLRIDQLIRNITEYKESDNYEDAMKCEIKYKELKMVSTSFKKLLD